GNFLADMLRDVAMTDVAIINNGGLRVNLPDGDLTYGKIYEILPFDNRVATVTVTGKGIIEAVLLGASGKIEGYSWSNVKAEITAGELTSLLIGNQPVDPERQYTVAYSDFLAGGGSGFDKLKWPEAKLWLDKPPMRDLIVGAIQDFGKAHDK